MARQRGSGRRAPRRAASLKTLDRCEPAPELPQRGPRVHASCGARTEQAARPRVQRLFRASPGWVAAASAVELAPRRKLRRIVSKRSAAFSRFARGVWAPPQIRRRHPLHRALGCACRDRPQLWSAPLAGRAGFGCGEGSSRRVPGEDGARVAPARLWLQASGPSVPTRGARLEQHERASAGDSAHRGRRLGV